MTDTLLISEAKVRAFSDLNNAVDSDLITNNIRVAQDLYLQDVIGTLLYEKIITLVDNSTIGDAGNSNYKYLLDTYIQDYLLYGAYYETLESIYLRPRNNGLLVPQGGENSAPADTSLYNQKRKSISNKMEYYGERLRKYIIEEEALFPELQANNKLYEQDPDYTTRYRAPFVFRKNRLEEMAREYGLKIYDSRYKQYPQ
jgi:hypothetical protein